VKVGEPFYTAAATTPKRVFFPMPSYRPAFGRRPLPIISIHPPAQCSGLVQLSHRGVFESSANEPLQDDKAGFRIDANTRWGFVPRLLLCGQIQCWSILSFPEAPSGSLEGAPPGLLSYNTVGNTKSFGAFVVNEFRFSYMRNPRMPVLRPAQTSMLRRSAFVVGCRGPGYGPQNPAYKTLPAVSTDTNSPSVALTNDESCRRKPSRWQENFPALWVLTLLNFGVFFLLQPAQRCYYHNTIHGAFVFSGSAERPRLRRTFSRRYPR